MARKIVCLTISALAFAAVLSQVQSLSLSTHILDTTKGLPSSDVTVKLYKLVGSVWLASTFNGKTDKDGRIRDFPLVDSDTNGVYKLRFETAPYFEKLGVETLYPFIEIPFEIKSESHYHIPLLLNPFGYSTYRGS